MSAFAHESKCDKNISCCKGCNGPTALISIIEKTESEPAKFTLLAGSKHLVFSPTGDVFHLEADCLKSKAPSSVIKNARDIPADSITDH